MMPFTTVTGPDDDTDQLDRDENCANDWRPHSRLPLICRQLSSQLAEDAVSRIPLLGALVGVDHAPDPKPEEAKETDQDEYEHC